MERERHLKGVCFRFEGRTWYTSHRGRLWIAAASKSPTEDDIKNAEKFFREVRAGKSLPLLNAIIGNLILSTDW